MTEPTNLVIYTDPGKDIDDEAALVMLASLTKIHNLVFPLAVVANLAPSDMRAQLARGTLDKLGMPTVPVIRGSNCGISEYHVWAHEFDVPYLAKDRLIFDVEDSDDATENAAFLVAKAMEMVPDKSVTLLLLSGFTDACTLLDHQGEVVRRKVREVVMMGGVEPLDETIEPDHRLMPANAFNVNVDCSSAKLLINHARDWGIPTVTVTRHATHAASISRSFFDGLSSSPLEVGQRICFGATNGLQSLWEAVHLPSGDPRRAGLLSRHTPKWFCEQYGISANAKLGAEDFVWGRVKRLHMHDPLTLMAAVPKLRELFFKPYVLTLETSGEPVDHLFIGLSPEEHGLIDPANVVGFIKSGITEGLS